MPRSTIPDSPSRRRLRLRRLGALAMLVAPLLLAIVPAAAFGDVTATPSAPPGVDGLQDLLNWTLYGGAITCAATAMFGLAKMGLSHAHQSYQGANHGKAVALLGFAGALGLGLTPTIVNGLTAVH